MAMQGYATDQWVTAALGLVVSMAVGAGRADHEKAAKAGVTGETIHSLNDPDVSQAEGDGAELEGMLEILHEDREDGSGVYRHFLLTHDGKRLSLEGVQYPDLLTGDLVEPRVSGLVRSSGSRPRPRNPSKSCSTRRFSTLASRRLPCSP